MSASNDETTLIYSTLLHLILLGSLIFVNLKFTKMKRSTFSVAYYIHRGKCLKNGQAPIIARITVNKQRAKFAVGRHVAPDDWRIENGCIKINSKEAKEINTCLTIVKPDLV